VASALADGDGCGVSSEGSVEEGAGVMREVSEAAGELSAIVDGAGVALGPPPEENITAPAIIAATSAIRPRITKPGMGLRDPEGGSEGGGAVGGGGT
jgi:hypothetical protein